MTHRRESNTTAEALLFFERETTGDGISINRGYRCIAKQREQHIMAESGPSDLAVEDEVSGALRKKRTQSLMAASWRQSVVSPNSSISPSLAIAFVVNYVGAGYILLPYGACLHQILPDLV